MKTFYTTKSDKVKAGYTIRMHGRVWHVRASHAEILKFLRGLSASRRAA